jgi:hypothetical protein
MKRLFVIVLAAILVCGVVQMAYAGRTSETPAGTILDPFVDKTASGTKVFGPMTAQYTILAAPGDPGTLCDNDNPPDGILDDYVVSMVVSIRLTKGALVHKFSSTVFGPVCYLDADAQSTFVYNWLDTSVIPGMFSLYQSWAVKSYNTIADCGFDPFNIYLPEPGCDTPFTTVDVDLAIRE